MSDTPEREAVRRLRALVRREIRTLRHHLKLAEDRLTKLQAGCPHVELIEYDDRRGRACVDCQLWVEA